MPFPPGEAGASSRVPSSYSRMVCVMRIEQNFGPHIEQNLASLKASSGSSSSCIVRAVSGSSESANCFSHSKFEARFGKRVVAVARAGAIARDVGGVRGDFISDDALTHIVFVGQAEMLFGRDVAQHRRARLSGERRADGAT